MEMNSTNLIVYVYKWRKPLIIVSVIAAVASAIFSGPTFIKPKFESSVVLFPSTTNSVSQALLVEKTSNSSDILEFGEEEEAEQLLQILNSDEIRSKIIQRYNLMEHYEIDPNEKFARTKLYEQYGDNISFRRTQYMSVVIEVLDEDPEMAADIANEIGMLVDTVKTRIQQERAFEGFKIVRKKYNDLQKDITTLEDSLEYLRTKGVQDYEAQISVLNEQYAVALIESKSGAAKAIKTQIDTLARYGGAYISIRDQLKFYYEELAKMKTRFEQARTDAETSLPHIFIVDRAYVAEKKKYPIRWLIVAVSTLGAFLATLLLIITRDTLLKARIK
jgi:uncharacterized protein involved in exopolysaccharide biosynthesis